MNFLTLCQTLRSEAGISGSGPATTVGQTGELGRIVSWILQAEQEIYDKRNDWGFLRDTFAFSANIGTSTYSRQVVSGLAEWKRDSFRIYSQAIGVIDETWLRWVPWELFRDTRLKGAVRLQTGRPIEFTIDPKKNVVLWPIPSDRYIVDGEFYSTAVTMINDYDVPDFGRFHMVIVYNALMRYAAWVNDPAVFANAQRNYGIQMSKLEREWAQEIVKGASLA